MIKIWLTYVFQITELIPTVLYFTALIKYLLIFIYSDKTDPQNVFSIKSEFYKLPFVKN